MSKFKKQLPTWDKAGVEPPNSKKAVGWQADERPPADYMNWFQNQTYEALKELQGNAAHKDEMIDKADKAEVETVSAQLADIVSDVQKVKNQVPQLREVYNDGSSEISSLIYSHLSKFEIKADGTVISKTAIDVLSNKAGSIVEISIYDDNLNKVLSTDKQEIISNGRNEFAFPHKILKSGTYYFGVSGFNEFKIRGDSRQGFIVNKVYPLTDSLSTIYEYSLSPYFEIFSYDLNTPIGFEFKEQTQYRVFCKSILTGKVYGWNTTSGKLCVSVNQGETFTDLMTISAAVWSMAIDDTNGRIYYGTSQGEIYESSGLTSNDTLTKITPSSKNPNAVLLPTGFTIWNGFVWYGEYSQAPNELGNVVNIHKYNLATKTWSISKAFTNARHAHSFTPVGTSSMYVTLGDADWGSNVGIHRITTVKPSGEDAWTKWTGLDGNFTTHYPVDNILTTLDGNAVLLGAADRPKMHLTLTKISNTVAGSANMSPRLFGFADSGTGETVRNVILDDEGNCYYVTAETNKPRICVSPYPYTQGYILKELSGLSVLTTPITKAGNWIMFHTFRFHTVSFGVKKAITLNKRNYLYNNGEVSTFTSGTSGAQTSNVNKNKYSLFIESISNQVAGLSQKTGYFTDNQIDLTNYKSVFVEGEYINCTGDNKLRIKVDTVTTIDGNVKEAIIQNTDLYVNQTFSLKLDVSNITGLHHVHVQSIATGLNAKATIKVNKIYLSEV